MKPIKVLTGLAVAGLLAAGCSSDLPQQPPMAGNPESGGSADTSGSKFFERAAYERQLELRDVRPEGPENKPWLQALDPQYIDTGEYKTKPPYHVCFSNAGLFNPWRQVGWTTMQAEVDLHPDLIEKFTVLHAEGKDNKQISDIGELASGNCDILIVSPNTTKTLTPAVEQACQKLPVIVFDRGVNTDCPVTFVHPIGGYAYGATGAEFLVDNVEPGGKILALRISPGVDVLEHRWAAAKRVFEDSQLEVIGVEFTEQDNATAKDIVTDYLARHGEIAGVWMDSGATAVAVVEAFQDRGREVPPITGEDQHDFLATWQKEDLTAIGVTYPTFQWRTAILASLDVLSGKRVPREWWLPQPTITEDNLGEYFEEGMPPFHYAMCGCSGMPGFPERWGGE